MAISYTVRARVVDLKSHTPRKGQEYLVDTNVWFWTAYASAPYSPITPRPYQMADYPAFLKTIAVTGGILRWSPFSWSELAHLIEATEHKIAVKWGAIADTVSLKEFRHSSAAERIRIGGEISDTWQQVERLGKPVSSSSLDQEAIARAAAEYPTVGVDGYDLFMIQSLRVEGFSGIISDDGDFCTVPEITLFTANRAVLGAAQAQGKLFVEK